MDMPATSERVAVHTAETVNRKLHKALQMRLCYYTEHPEEIGARLTELNEEWDIERTLEANATTLGMIGLGLGATVSRKYFFLPTIVMGFLFQHALQGWCPPIPLFRRFGVRTQTEIETERYALKALRGDFEPVAQQTDGGDRHKRAQEALRVVSH